MEYHAVCNVVRREKEKRGDLATIEDIIGTRSHHLLGNDGMDILVFGQSNAVPYLSLTALIQADGTFKCVVPPYKQLYVFHGVLHNNVSFPLLYCLVKGKDQSLYERLLHLVEQIAAARRSTIFNRPVEVMTDFEQAFIAALRQNRAGSHIVCCFFHFVSSLRKRLQPLVNQLARTERENAGITRLAEATKCALMMLPLLPRELITMGLVNAVIGRCTAAFGHTETDFKAVREYIEATYVGAGARFPVRLWSVSGRNVRTNNAAESSHARLNAHLHARKAVSVNQFLGVIETEMHNVSKEIRSGCQSHSKAIFSMRDDLLGAELEQLFLGGQSVLKFLDHCASVTQLDNEEHVWAFVERRRKEEPDESDKAWIAANRARVVDAAVGLHRRLLPGSQMSVQTIMSTIRSWTFMDVPCIILDDVADENSELSLVVDEPRESFLEIVREMDN